MAGGPFETLGLAPGASEAEVRRAYAARLKAVRPETDPEGFMALREAYERARRLARQRRRAEEAEADEVEAEADSPDVSDEAAGIEAEAEAEADAGSGDENEGAGDAEADAAPERWRSPRPAPSLPLPPGDSEAEAEPEASESEPAPERWRRPRPMPALPPGARTEAAAAEEPDAPGGAADPMEVFEAFRAAAASPWAAASPAPLLSAIDRADLDLEGADTLGQSLLFFVLQQSNFPLMNLPGVQAPEADEIADWLSPALLRGLDARFGWTRGGSGALPRQRAWIARLGDVLAERAAGAEGGNQRTGRGRQGHAKRRKERKGEGKDEGGAWAVWALIVIPVVVVIVVLRLTLGG